MSTSKSFSSVNQVLESALKGELGPSPKEITATGAFDIVQTTQFPNTTHRYFNRYIVFRVGASFGACCIEPEQVERSEVAQLSGSSISQLLQHESLVIRVAALDAYLGFVASIDSFEYANKVTLPKGTPIERAIVRDQSIVEMLDCKEKEKVGLIGVVNPLVEAIENKGAQCLPCDFNMQKTSTGLHVTKDMTELLNNADQIIATGMTLSNGSFDHLLNWSQTTGKKLTIYAQTGANIARFFFSKGVENLLVETFPFSQFSADETPIFQCIGNRT